MLLILPIVLGFVCIQMLVVVVHTGLIWLWVILMTCLSQLCLEATTVNLHVTGDRDISHSIRIVWSVTKVVPSFSTEETKVTGKRFQFRLTLHCSTQQVKSLQTSFQVLWRSLCWLRWCRGVLAMWWLEKMSKQPGDRSLYGFNNSSGSLLNLENHTALVHQAYSHNQTRYTRLRCLLHKRLLLGNPLRTKPCRSLLYSLHYGHVSLLTSLLTTLTTCIQVCRARKSLRILWHICLLLLWLLLGHCVLKPRRNISFRCLSIHPRSLRLYCALSTLLTRCSRHRWQSSATTTTISLTSFSHAHLGSLDPFLLRLYELQAGSSATMRKVALPSKPLDLPGSAPRTSSLRNKRPSTQTKSINPRAQPLFRTQTSNKRRCLCSCRYVPCWRVTSLTQNRCGVACWHLSVNFTKNDQNTCRHKKSLHQDMVCLFK